MLNVIISIYTQTESEKTNINSLFLNKILTFETYSDKELNIIAFLLKKTAKLLNQKQILYVKNIYFNNIDSIFV